jgi:hypothetical protein
MHARAFLHRDSIARTHTGGQAKELDMQDGMHMDIGQELARLKRTLHDAQRRIMFRAEVATVKNCRKLVRALGLVAWLATRVVRACVT